MGNYDDAVGNEKDSCGCSYNPGRETEVGDESLSWVIRMISSENKRFLKNFPKKLSLVYGSPLNYLFVYVKAEINAERLKIIAKSVEEEIIITGHTHLMMTKRLFGKTILNPGSVGRTKDKKSGATYLIIGIDKEVFNYKFKFVE